MSNATNQNIMDNIEMQVLSANYSFEDLLDELQMTYQEHGTNFRHTRSRLGIEWVVIMHGPGHVQTE